MIMGDTKIPLALSTKDAAKFIGVSKQRLDLSRITGNLCGTEPPPFFRIGKKLVRYKVSDLEKWVELQSTYTTLAEEFVS